MDVIEDTELAIQTFKTVTFPETEDGRGMPYLATYGLLQALFLQQDAEKNMANCVGVDHDPRRIEDLREIREVRNDAIGHTTGRGNNGPNRDGVVSVHYISRITMTERGFQYLSDYRDGQFTANDISFEDMMVKQERAIITLLDELINHMEEEAKMKKEQFRDEKLERYLPETLSYSTSKIVSSASPKGDPNPGLFNVNYLIKALSDFRSALERRGFDLKHNAGLEEEYDFSIHSLLKLKEYLEDKKSSVQSLDWRSATIFALDLCNRIDALSEMAKELDRYYAGTE